MTQRRRRRGGDPEEETRRRRRRRRRGSGTTLKSYNPNTEGGEKQDFYENLENDKIAKNIDFGGARNKRT